MENASKALIIAGAILLSILIISLGLMVYNNAKATVGSADLSEAEISAFNAKFTSYVGTNITGSQVNAMLQLVFANNTAEANAKSGRYVTVYTTVDYTGSEYLKQGDTKVNNVVSGKNYTVKVNYGSTGLIDKITFYPTTTTDTF